MNRRWLRGLNRPCYFMADEGAGGAGGGADNTTEAN